MLWFFITWKFNVLFNWKNLYIFFTNFGCYSSRLELLCSWKLITLLILKFAILTNPLYLDIYVISFLFFFYSTIYGISEHYFSFLSGQVILLLVYCLFCCLHFYISYKQTIDFVIRWWDYIQLVFLWYQFNLLLRGDDLL